MNGWDLVEREEPPVAWKRTDPVETKPRPDLLPETTCWLHWTGRHEDLVEQAAWHKVD